MASITLTKHHGLGNDFLIAVDPGVELTADDARRWCDRHRGVGADGLIMASSLGEDPSGWAMTLWNADGSRAELSGNGLRCLGQALVLNYDDGRASWRFQIATDAGSREIEVAPTHSSDTEMVTVGMGRPAAGPPLFDGWSMLGVVVDKQLGVDVGNPHIVALVGDLATVDLDEVGPAVEGHYPDGLNVHLVTVGPDRQSMDLRVWERGVGITEACGTGACAAAWAAHEWGLVDDRVEVTMPGGAVTVDLVAGDVFLTGPATFVAVVEIEQVA